MSLSNECAKILCKRKVLVQLIIKNMVTCFWNTVYMNLVHWPLTGGLLDLVQQGGDWAGLQPAQAYPRCTKCNRPPINGQCTNHRIAV